MTWILTNVMFVSEEYVFNFLFVEAESFMDDNESLPGASNIFRMIDVMLRSN